MYSSDCPRTHCADQVNLELMEILPPGINGVYHHCLRQGLTAELTTLCLLSSGITAVHCHIWPVHFSLSDSLEQWKCLLLP